ncbi:MULTISPECIES: helix-turn-helix transcriptional regulator [unclassified Actinopolyspora]|uniref:helix-turn-helix domain-containing protein n=1 Tax=unclassified Actinopolyspora TaxID=2639451 RepID=UPI0013F5E1B8|nr:MULTISPECIES: helix-turn-helix transcriptional regulator [unclassified Actinopolyspora]NHD18560.1 helix-turn-helix domain-containing protein [Actinopolyspora sp. BKK2]NHE77481.1 helix-turn-helix domain-containing protein [Actinopolyspora sp. BKK1]
MARTMKHSPRVRALGAELREARESAGMTMRDVAQKLGWHHSKYARFEAGDQPPTSEQVSAILATYGASDSERERLTEMANEIATGDANWLKAGSGHDELTTLLEFERTATSIVDVSPILVPGLLQTSDYARTIMAGEPPGEVERLVAMRIGRRDVLTRSKPVDFTAVIAESALRQPMGGRAVMADQLRHIAKMSELDNVTVHVLPHELTSWTPAHAGPFILFDFAKTAPIVHHEHLSSSAFLSGLGDIRTHREAAVNLREAAMNPTDSAEFILRCATDMEDY